MIKLVSYDSGAVDLVGEEAALSLDRDQAHRLILTARMHGIEDFIKKLPPLLNHSEITARILNEFESKSPSQRWALKEKFARLRTTTKGYVSASPLSISEEIEFAVK